MSNNENVLPRTAPGEDFISASDEVVVREMAASLGLDGDRIVEDLDLGRVTPSVALFGPESGWPPSHVETAREVYRLD